MSATYFDQFISDHDVFVDDTFTWCFLDQVAFTGWFELHPVIMNCLYVVLKEIFLILETMKINFFF